MALQASSLGLWGWIYLYCRDGSVAKASAAVTGDAHDGAAHHDNDDAAEDDSSAADEVDNWNNIERLREAKRRDGTAHVTCLLFQQGVKLRIRMRVVHTALSTLWAEHSRRIEDAALPTGVLTLRIAAAKSPFDSVSSMWTILSDTAKLSWCGVTSIPDAVAQLMPPTQTVEELWQTLRAVASAHGWSATSGTLPHARLALLLQPNLREDELRQLVRDLVEEWGLLLALEQKVADGADVAEQAILRQLHFRECTPWRCFFALLKRCSPTVSSLLRSLLQAAFCHLAESRIVENVHQRLRLTGRRSTVKRKRANDGGLRHRTLQAISSDKLEDRSLQHSARKAMDSATELPTLSASSKVLWNACEPLLKIAPTFLSDVLVRNPAWASPTPATSHQAASAWAWVREANRLKVPLCSGWCAKLAPPGAVLVHSPQKGDSQALLNLGVGEGRWAGLVALLESGGGDSEATLRWTFVHPSQTATVMWSLHEGQLRDVAVHEVKPVIVNGVVQLEAIGRAEPLLAAAFVRPAVLETLDDWAANRLLCAVSPTAAAGPVPRSRVGKLHAIAEAIFEGETLAAAKASINLKNPVDVQPVDSLLATVVEHLASADKADLAKEASAVADQLRRNMQKAQHATRGAIECATWATRSGR